ncbi:MAG: hypothetical protein ACI4EG_04770 [Fusicatenibacter sp.]|nr:hypothetical protein [Fusicatenibacter sp.]
MRNIHYIPVTGTILNLAAGSDCCSQMMTLRTESGIVNFIIGPDTLIIDQRQLRQGMRVTAFYDGNMPVPLIYPPQYRALVAAALRRDEQVLISFFDRNLLSADQSLKLNIGRNTQITTGNGQRFPCNVGNRTLFVSYTATTRSIPPQTTPERIVVLC